MVCSAARSPPGIRPRAVAIRLRLASRSICRPDFGRLGAHLTVLTILSQLRPAHPDGLVCQWRKNVTAVGAKWQQIDAYDSLRRKSAVEVRKQRPAARGLPFKGAAKPFGIDADQQQIALTSKMFCGGFGNLGCSREMNEIVALIDLGAEKYAGAFGLSP